MSGFIPYDELMLGKALYVIERKADFLNGTVDANVIPTVLGQATAIEQSLTMKNAVASGGSYIGGFETIAFQMRNESGTSKDVVMAASLTMNSVMWNSAVAQTLTFTDGTNSLKMYASGTAMAETNTLLDVTIGGTTATKTLAINHNFSGNGHKRYCPTLRIDKGRGLVELYVGGGLYGRTEVDGLASFGQSKFQYRFTHATQNARTVSVRQVILRLEC